MNKKKFHSTLTDLLGELPTDFGFKRRMRLHQGWWRSFVLNEEIGSYKAKDGEIKQAANLLNNTNVKGNFLNERVEMIAKEKLSERNEQDSGIIEKDRLFRNLLSSQPLCFNFFAEFECDKEFARSIFKNFIPNLTTVKKVMFEYAPSENYTKDRSAFDVAFEIETNQGIGLFGLECKYTDTFSFKRNNGLYYGEKTDKNYLPYKKIFNSSRIHFKAHYNKYIKSSIQLIRK